MDDNLVRIAISFVVIAFIGWTWRVVNWAWLRPKNIEKCLREQGLHGNPYTLLHGDSKELVLMAKQAKQKPIHLNDDICPTVLPFYHHIIKTHGKNSFTWIGPIARVNVMEPELIKEILTNNEVFKKPIPNPLAKFLVCGLSGYEDEKWYKHRKIINPAFRIEILKNMLPAMYLSCSEMMNKWEMLIDGKERCELNVQPYIETLTSNVISRTAFGSSYEESTKIFELQKEQAELTLQVLLSVYIPGWRFLPTKSNKRMKAINNELTSLFKAIITKKEKSMNLGESADHDDDLLSLLLKSNQQEIRQKGNIKTSGMTTGEIIEECKTFYFSGQEGTSNLLTWAMVLLSIHPNWQVLAREEVCRVFGNNQPDYDGLNHLKIVTMILNEVLRLYPPSIIFTRIIYKETKLGKTIFPPGVQFLLPILLVHRDCEIWGEDAKEFKPERFSEGVAYATKNRLSFFPFSWGPRICIGNNFAMLEAKMALAMIFQRFSFELSPSYTHTPSFILTLKPQYGAHLILRKI